MKLSGKIRKDGGSSEGSPKVERPALDMDLDQQQSDLLLHRALIGRLAIACGAIEEATRIFLVITVDPTNLKVGYTLDADMPHGFDRRYKLLRRLTRTRIGSSHPELLEHFLSVISRCRNVMRSRNELLHGAGLLQPREWGTQILSLIHISEPTRPY